VVENAASLDLECTIGTQLMMALCSLQPVLSVTSIPFHIVVFIPPSFKVTPLEAAAAKAQKELTERQKELSQLSKRFSDAQASLATCLADIEDAKDQQVRI